MKKQYPRTLLAFVTFVGLGGIAQAGVRDEIVVTLPLDFVARGETAHGVYTFSISRTTIIEASTNLTSATAGKQFREVSVTSLGAPVCHESFNHSVLESPERL